MQIMTIKNCPVSISIGDSKLTLFSGSSTTLIILNIIQMRTTKTTTHTKILLISRKSLMKFIYNAISLNAMRKEKKTDTSYEYE